MPEAFDLAIVGGPAGAPDPLPVALKECVVPDFLETTVDKFIFRVATDRRYTPEGIWALEAGHRIRVGVTDLVQQLNGDVAFAEARPVGTTLARGDELALIETIKVNLGVPSPIGGVIAVANPALELSPEVINQDPYGEGWLVEVDAADWAADRESLLDADTYFGQMREQAEAETSKR